MTEKLTPFERRLEELFFIINQEQTSISELSGYFSVSECTIYRDIEFLSRYAPIYTKNGRFGGVFISKEYNNLIVPYLSNTEKELLVSLSKSVCDKQKMLLNNIIKKFSVQNVSKGV